MAEGQKRFLGSTGGSRLAVLLGAALPFQGTRTSTRVTLLYLVPYQDVLERKVLRSNGISYTSSSSSSSPPKASRMALAQV